ncbi:MAG TPA: cytidylate kinase family protein [Candidatus Tectomicrobia bacterium]|nr:cytidylate kinase family protein [Candidatus Tectomicrobia bacterium]
MAIITIARQIGSLGNEIAADVAQQLQYTLVDQTKLQEAAEAYGMLKSELEEVHEKRPTLVTRYLTMRHRAYLDMIQTITYQYARADDVVILGRGATVLLSDVPSALHVNLFAPFERRVAVVMQREGITRPLAEQIVRESDQDRAGYMRYLFDCDWMDPSLYDVMINTHLITRGGACELIVKAAHAKELLDAHDESLVILGNHILVRRAEEALLKAKQVNPRHISVTVVTPGVAKLTGIVNSEKEKLAAEAVVRTVPGVSDVENELYVTITPIDHLDFV